MTETNPFVMQWLAKLENALRLYLDQRQIKQLIPIEGNRVRDIVNRIEELVGAEKTRQVVLECACRYPVEDLQPMRQAYEKTGDVRVPHRMLQESFVAMLRNQMKLEENMIGKIVGRGWGSAGVLDGERLVATKIPKSGFLLEYMNESDPERRRKLYCHCPLIRDAIASDVEIPEDYCYCGAGFYRGVWQEILQRPVGIRILKSIAKGDDVCSFELDLSLRENDK